MHFRSEEEGDGGAYDAEVISFFGRSVGEENLLMDAHLDYIFGRRGTYSHEPLEERQAGAGEVPIMLVEALDVVQHRTPHSADTSPPGQQPSWSEMNGIDLEFLQRLVDTWEESVPSPDISPENPASPSAVDTNSSYPLPCSDPPEILDSTRTNPSDREKEIVDVLDSNTSTDEEEDKAENKRGKKRTSSENKKELYSTNFKRSRRDKDASTSNRPDQKPLTDQSD